MAENILINFEVDSSGLAPAVDQLERLGAIDKEAAAAFRATNAELGKRTQQLGAINKAAQQSGSATKKSIDDLDKSVQKLTQDIIEGMQEGVADALKEAGVSAKEFSDALAKGNTEVSKSSETLRERLRTITQELQTLKAAGKDNTDQYRLLVAEAGNLQDAMADVSQEIRNVGSDTRVLDGVIGVAQGIAGGFAVAQGAAALFGAENEELQEVLLRVNATMAILQGLQQVSNVLQKESSALKLADIVITKIQTAAQAAFAVVVGTSTGALRAFRIALAATGVGALIIAFGFIIQKIIDFTEATNDAAESEERFNKALEDTEKRLSADNAALDAATKKRIALSKQRGDAESEQQKIELDALKQREQRIAAEIRLQTQLFQLEVKNGKVSEEVQKAYNKRVSELGAERLALNNEIAVAEIELETKLTEEIIEQGEKRQAEREKAAAEAKRLAEEAAQRLRELRNQELQDQLAALERQLLAAQEAGTETLRIEQQIIGKKAELDLNAEKLTQNEIKLIRERAAADQLRIARENAQQLSNAALEGLIAQNNAELTQLNLSAAERLRLQEENIITAAQLEVNAAENNSAKIKAIEAKRDADIKANRLRSIQEAVDYEIQLQQARSGAYLRENEKIASDTEASQAERFAAIDELTNHEIESIDKRQAALNKQLQDGLISRRDYDLQYEQLADQAEEAVEKSEQRKTDILKAEEQKRREEVQRTIDFTIETAQQVLQVIQEFFSQQSEAELNRVDEQRKQVEDLRESGAITEKEAQARLKRLDQEERKIRAQQAQRDKQIAIFNAVINTAQAFTRALATGGPVFAAIVAALGAAQIALIASRPIPKFGKGKKNNYQGLAEIGETGSELVEKNGQLYVAPARTIVWLGAKDKVYNPEETRHMLEARGGRAQQIKRVDSTGAASNVMDYEKLGKVIARNTPGLSLNIDGYKDFVIQGHAFTTYLNNRRSYK